MRAHHVLFLLAYGVLLATIVFGFRTRTPPPYPDGPSGQLVSYVTPNSIEYIGGGPVWAVFERGVIYGDAIPMSPLETMLMRSNMCVENRGDDLAGQTKCGRSIRWIDISNPTPFMLAVVLIGAGVFLKARRIQPQQVEGAQSSQPSAKSGAHE
jgi:hypothetical protein